MTDREIISVPRIGFIFTSDKLEEQYGMPADTAWEIISVSVTIEPGPLGTGIGKPSVLSICTLLPLDSDGEDMSDKLSADLPKVNMDMIDCKPV